MAQYIDPGHKILAFGPALSDLLKGKLVYPINVEFDISNACPLACNYCLYCHTHDGIMTSLEHAHKIIDELASVGMKSITYSGGGEPLVNRAFPEIVEYAWRKGICQGLYTNGILADKFLLPILRYLDWVHFSVFAATPPTYARITGHDLLDQVLENIRLFVRHKGRLVVGMGMVIGTDNEAEIEGLYQLGENLGVDFVGFKPDCMITDSAKLLEWWRRVDQLPDDRVSKSSYRFIGQSARRPYSLCLGHYFLGCVGADGNLYFCGSYRSNPDYSLGSLVENSFEELWSSERHRGLMRGLDMARCPMPACRPDVHNRLLDRMLHPSPHVEFL